MNNTSLGEYLLNATYTCESKALFMQEGKINHFSNHLLVGFVTDIHLGMRGSQKLLLGTYFPKNDEVALLKINIITNEWPVLWRSVPISDAVKESTGLSEKYTGWWQYPHRFVNQIRELEKISSRGMHTLTTDALKDIPVEALQEVYFREEFKGELQDEADKEGRFGFFKFRKIN